jgi:hypothetical protein
MELAAARQRKQLDAAEDGCAYVLADRRPDRPDPFFCNAPRRPGSAYCPEHHALCHLPSGSAAEHRQLRRIEALAAAVGGKVGRIAGQPPAPLLRRLERVNGAFSRADCSRIVRRRETMPASLANAPASTDGAPAAERQQHGPIERLDRPIGDNFGNPSRPYRAFDTLAVMERRGSITAGMRQAGEDFRARFTLAQLDPLRALDLSHLRLGERSLRPDGEGPGLRIEAARKAVWVALQTVGGPASPAGSCLWHVLGLERSLKEWALEQGWSGRRVSQEAASGILVAALGALEAHFSAS